MSESLTTGSRRKRRTSDRSLVRSSRFAYADLLCAVSAGGLWYVSNGRLGPWPLLLAGLPWIVRLTASQRAIKQTRFDGWLLVFLITAVVGVWAAYDVNIAREKFWLLLGGAVLFYALAGQPSANIWPITIGLGAGAVLVALYFLLTTDWQALPTKIDTIGTVASYWMRVRPTFLLGAHALHPNVAGGIMTMLFPFLAASGLRAFRRRHWAGATAALLAVPLFSASLALTSSRGAWLALIAGLIGWLLWSAAGKISQRLFLSRRQVLGLALIVVLGIGLTVALILPGGLVGLLDRLPGPASAGSRLTITRDAIDLAGDFPLTGGGLSSFDGLYSQYIRVIPNHFLIHGHNLFLNILVEQGAIALTVFVGMMVTAIWWLADPSRSGIRRSISSRSLLCGALLASFVVMFVHGLVDDPLYGSRGALLLWVPLGMTATIFPHRPIDEISAATRKPILMAVGVLLLVAVAVVVIYRDTVEATWQSNLGAIEMARVELAGYPSGEWADESLAGDLTGSAARFERALALDPNNRTAWHRLGLIAHLRRDFGRATDALGSAHQIDPDHRGIRKALAYDLVWAGDVPAALPYLSNIPEAAGELNTYTWWWSAQGRDDLSRHAAEAAQQLAAPVP